MKSEPSTLGLLPETFIRSRSMSIMGVKNKTIHHRSAPRVLPDQISRKKHDDNKAIMLFEHLHDRIYT